MKINSTQQYINQSYTANNINAGTTAKKSGGAGKKSEDILSDRSDRINLSSTTKDLHKISTASAQEPKDRAQMVEDLKQQVQSDQYTVNADQVAEKMIGSIMDEAV